MLERGGVSDILLVDIGDAELAFGEEAMNVEPAGVFQAIQGPFHGLSPLPARSAGRELQAGQALPADLDDVKSALRSPVNAHQRDDDPEQWIYLERMLPSEFSYERVKQRWGGGAYRIRYSARGVARGARKSISRRWHSGSTKDFRPRQHFEFGCGM